MYSLKPQNNIFQGHSTLGCGKEDCFKGWNPDIEEQRYCYKCRLWFHTACAAATDKTQGFIVEKAKQKESLAEELPTVLFEMACQPAARGGDRHFAAGNIRIVTKAKDLVGIR